MIRHHGKKRTVLCHQGKEGWSGTSWEKKYPGQGHGKERNDLAGFMGKKRFRQAEDSK